MKEILDTYYDFIEVFEKLMMKEYDIHVNPYIKAGSLFEQKGVIGEYEYQYHGSGCTLKKNGTICEYNIVPVNKPGIKFSLWSFSEFVNSNPNYKDLNYSSEYIEQSLEKLMDKGLLHWDEIDGHPIKIYMYDKYKLRIID